MTTGPRIHDSTKEKADRAAAAGKNVNRSPFHHCSGAVLAGGLNQRMGGLRKADLTLGGKTFLARIGDVLQSCFEECLLVIQSGQDRHEGRFRVVTDIMAERGAMAGIHAGLVHASTPFVFFSACDIPFLSQQVVSLVAGGIEPGVDIVVPFSGTYYQPLCALYSKRCIPLIEAQLERGERKVDRLFELAAVKRISYDRIKTADPNLRAFFNINTPEDLMLAKRIASDRIDVPKAH